VTDGAETVTHRHKKAFDEARLKLEERSVKVQEDKLHGLSSDVETIKSEAGR